nr:retrovirus-related Pol polyprotein from transposon TNT 1-94 [Tanacetum cinerariifolium]
DTSKNTKFAKQPIVENLSKIGETNALSKPVTLNSVSTPQESKGVDNTKTKRPQPRSNTKHDRVPSAFKSSRSKNKEAEVEEHHRNLPLSKNNKHISSACNNIQIDSHDVIQICLWCVDLGCSKHMTGNLKLLINFVWKFLGTVCFENDHVAAILGFGQFCDSDLEVAFRRNACFVKNLEGDDLLKGDRSTNIYTINLHEMASASPICLMARASFTKSWLGHQRLSHLNFDTINDLARNDLVTGLPKFKYHKEHLCPSLEQRNQTLVEAARTMLIFSRAPLFLWAEAIATACFTQNRSIIHRRFNKTPYELINGRKSDISFLHVFGALCYPKNDREDIGKLGAKGDIGFFIGYSADSCAYRVYNRRTKKIMETMNVSFDELSAMAFEQRSSKPKLQSMTSGQISSGLDLTYAPSTITTQQPSESELDLLFEAIYDAYIGGQPPVTARTVSPAQEPQVCQSSTASTTIADTAPILTNSSSLATNVPITSQDVDELNPNAMVDGNTFVNPFANSSTSAVAASFSQNCDECKYEKILYDKAYKDMQQKIERLQAQLEDLKGKSKDTSSVSDTRNPSSQKLDNENVELEFQVLNYARENAHLKATYKNLFDSISVSHNTQDKSENTKFAKQPIVENLSKIGETNALSKPVTSNSVSTPQESKSVNNDKLLINFVWKFMGTVRFGNDHVAAILGFGDLQWRNILITRVYFIEGLGHNLFSIGQFCDSDLEVAFRRNACFIRNLEGVDLLKSDRSTNLYTINLHEMASASPICLMARASSTKSWLWH